MSVIGHLLDDYQEWVGNSGTGTVQIDYIEDEDIFSVSRNSTPAVAVFPSEIDLKFYNEDQAVFVESEVGVVPEEFDLASVMQFSGDELVLSRISLSERDDEDSKTMVVEAALPNSMIDFALFDLVIREVATIANDLRNQLFSEDGAEESEDEAESEEASDGDDGDSEE